MPFLDQRNTKIYYEYLFHETHSPVITLVNGHTRPSNDFKSLSKKLFESGINVLLFDNRGSGQTISHSEFTFLDYVNDVIDLWDELSIKTSHLLGISMGGMISQTIANQYPSRVSRLILVSTASKAATVIDETPWENDLSKIESKLNGYFAPSFATNSKLLVKSMAKQILKRVQDGEYIEDAHKQRSAIKGFNISTGIPNFPNKTLILHGELDGIIPIEEAKKLKDSISESELKLFSGCGHLLLAENPKGLLEATLQFIN